jgi:hypothetical protein
MSCKDNDDKGDNGAFISLKMEDEARDENAYLQAARLRSLLLGIKTTN